MAYREVTMLEVKEVLRLWLTGVRKKRIAAQLGLNVKTVRRDLRAAPAHGLATPASPDPIDILPMPGPIEDDVRAFHVVADAVGPAFETPLADPLAFSFLI